MRQNNVVIRRVKTCNGVRFVARRLAHYSRNVPTRAAYTFSVTPHMTREEVIIDLEQRLTS